MLLLLLLFIELLLLLELVLAAAINWAKLPVKCKPFTLLTPTVVAVAADVAVDTKSGVTTPPAPTLVASEN